MGKIFIIMGKSATGKDTVFKHLMQKEALELRNIVTYTTRPMREGEKNGVEYYFVSEKEFREMKAAGMIIEDRRYDTVYGPWYYFTADDGQIDLKRQDYLVIVTLEGYERYREFFGEDKVVPVYIAVDPGIQLERALFREKRQREPKYAEMCRRFLADEDDFSAEKIKRAGIEKIYDNIDFSHCISKIIADIQREKDVI